jgi:5'-deoxynucleotidase YfbR-like HD superfamily hydrolase
VTAPALGLRFREALAYAAEVHRDQLRKGTAVPYLAHLLAVAALVIEDAGRAGAVDEDEAIAALLHDAAEDQGGAARLDDIRARFGPRVAEIVAACSDTLGDEASKPPWRPRKEAHLRHLEDADPGVLRVSVADKVHNLRAVVADYRELGDALWARFNRDADPRWYYAALSELASRRAPGPLADELARSLAELDGLIAAAPAPPPGARWERRGRLLAGPHPGKDAPPEAAIAALRDAGVGLIVDLTGEGDALPDYEGLLGEGMRRLNRPVSSGGVPDAETIGEIVNAMDAAVDAGEAVYVHCRGGGGRTDAVVDAWLNRPFEDSPGG